MMYLLNTARDPACKGRVCLRVDVGLIYGCRMYQVPSIVP